MVQLSRAVTWMSRAPLQRLICLAYRLMRPSHTLVHGSRAACRPVQRAPGSILLHLRKRLCLSLSFCPQFFLRGEGYKKKKTGLVGLCVGNGASGTFSSCARASVGLLRKVFRLMCVDCWAKRVQHSWFGSPCICMSASMPRDACV